MKKGKVKQIYKDFSWFRETIGAIIYLSVLFEHFTVFFDAICDDNTLKNDISQKNIFFITISNIFSIDIH